MSQSRFLWSTLKLENSVCKTDWIRYTECIFHSESLSEDKHYDVWEYYQILQYSWSQAQSNISSFKGFPEAMWKFFLDKVKGILKYHVHYFVFDQKNRKVKPCLIK